MNDLPEGFKMTELGALPEEWDVVRLGDVTEKTKQKDPKKTPEWKFKYVDVSSISRGALKIAECKLCQGKDAPSRAKRLVKNKDVIFATVRPTLKRLTLINEEFDGEICSTAFCVLRATENILNPLYLFYAVQRDVFIDEFEKVQRGASYPAITDSDVKNQKIPLPPPPEQHRIAAVLSAVQDAKEKTEAVIAAAKSLKKSLMRHLFTYGPVPAGAAESVALKETEIGLVPEGWEMVRLGEAIRMTQYGISLRGNQQGQYPILRMSNLIDGRVNTSDLQYVDLDEDGFNKFRLNDGDILFNRTNSFELVGKTSLFCACDDFVFASYLIRVVPDTTSLMPEYLNYCLNWDTSQIRLKTLASRGVSQSNINATKLKGFSIPLPPLSTQQKIASFLSAVDTKIEKEENKKKALEGLFKTLLNNLMAAKIRVNDMVI